MLIATLFLHDHHNQKLQNISWKSRNRSQLLGSGHVFICFMFLAVPMEYGVGKAAMVMKHRFYIRSIFLQLFQIAGTVSPRIHRNF